MPYIKNNKLIVIKEEYPGNLFKNNKFMGPDGKFKKTSFHKLIRWGLSKKDENHKKNTYKNNTEVIEQKDLFNLKDDMIVWLGHASFLIRLNQKSIITDPCYNNIIFRKRLKGLPFELDNIKNTDCILISHGHFDHLDFNSLSYFFRNNSTKYLLPLKMEKLLKSLKKEINVQEAGWFQKYDEINNIEIFFLPSKHWHRRGIMDLNAILWGSFLIKYRDKKIFFAGDTAYGNHFKEIGNIFGPIDYCLMPIGAYKPEYIMKSSHTNPTEAIQAFNDLKGRYFIPMHYGTYKLSAEPVNEPLELLFINKNMLNGELIRLNIGEILPL